MKDLFNDLQGSKRLEGEDFDRYKIRRRIENKLISIYLKRGIQVWDSINKGTYVKEK